MHFHGLGKSELSNPLNGTCKEEPRTWNVTL